MEKAILQKIEMAAVRYHLSNDYTTEERLQALKESKGRVFENLCNIFGLSDKEINYLYNL
jgi:hypothetical protein